MDDIQGICGHKMTMVTEGDQVRPTQPQLELHVVTIMVQHYIEARLGHNDHLHMPLFQGWAETQWLHANIPAVLSLIFSIIIEITIR